MSDIFNEIDEEVRRDKMMSWWKKNMVSIVVGAVIAVGGVAGYKIWQNQQLGAAQQSAGEYYDILKSLQADETALVQLDGIIKKYPDGVGLLAEFKKAQNLTSAGKLNEAISLYEKIATSAPEDIFKEAALVRAGYLQIDTADVKALEAKLGGLNNAGNPWRNNAREIMGMSAWRTGDLKKAHDLFNQILADRLASPGVSRRAQIMAALIAPKLK